MNYETASRLFSYNPDTGHLHWVINPNPKAQFGDSAGKPMGHGYVCFCYSGKTYAAHRICWLLFYGKYPDYHIDHINHDRADNRIVNLRDAAKGENHRNASLSIKNKSGISGVQSIGKNNLWIAGIGIKGKSVMVYKGDDFFEACCKRKSAEVEYDYHPNHGK